MFDIDNETAHYFHIIKIDVQSRVLNAARDDLIDQFCVYP